MMVCKNITYGVSNYPSPFPDEAPLLVEFDPVTYSVIEGGQVLLTVVLNTAADQAVTVSLTTRDINSAIGCASILLLC